MVTPLEYRNGVYFKREDSFEFAGLHGAKVRACMALSLGSKAVVAVSARISQLGCIVAAVARARNIACRVYTAWAKELSPNEEFIQACGAELVQVKPGYMNVLQARAREDAASSGAALIPFGLESETVFSQVAAQTQGIEQWGIKRVVIPVGSGTTLVGVYRGLRALGLQMPIFGVAVGRDPRPLLNRHLPDNWQDRVTLIESGSKYHEPASITALSGIELDPIYEAKCIPHILPGDCLWIVGYNRIRMER